MRWMFCRLFRTYAVLVMIIGLILPDRLYAHVADNAGQTLQLFSYKMTGPEPVLDGDIATTNPGEWKEAYNRRIILSPDGDAANDTATILIMNNDSCLFIALAYEWDNTGEENAIHFYFDEGPAGHSHDDALTAGNENGLIYEKDGIRHDLYWDGTVWQTDADGDSDFTAAWDWSATINNIEFRIPLDNGKTDDASNSDLNVDADDEIGFLFKIFKMGKGFSDYVSWTQFPDTAAGTAANYADLRLGVEKKYITFYATHADLGVPTLDGDIAGDDAWRGCYQRTMVMTNFAGDVRTGTLYLTEDAANDDIYIGFRMEDSLYNAGDYLRLYGEQEAGLAGDSADGKLNNDAENCLEMTAGGVFSDLYYQDALTNFIPGTWGVDGDIDDQDGAVAYSAAADRYDFEIHMIKDGGTRDLDLNDNAWCQMLVEYVDVDKPVGEQKFYWTASTNNIQILADQALDPPNRIASGWSRLQLGSPYIQVIYPQDGATVSGDVNVRIYACDENADGIVSARFYRAADTSATWSLTRIAGLDEWSGSWNTGSLANAGDTLIIRVTDDDGNITERLVELTVDNAGGAADPPEVTISAPAAGSAVGGITTISFSATGSAAIQTTEISIDGGTYTATATATMHAWNTAAVVQGSHTVRIRAVDANGTAGYSEVTTYVVDNSPSAAITSPAADAEENDSLTVMFATSAVAPATVDSVFISIDGGPFAVTATDSSHVLPTALWNDGSHSIQVMAMDSEGRTGLSRSVMFMTDNRPAVVINAPDPDSVVSGAVSIQFAAAVIPSAVVQTAEISVDGGAYAAASSLTAHTLVTDSLADGSHMIRVRVTDSYGRSAESGMLQLLVYNTPAVVITAPAAGTGMSGTAVISFTTILPGAALLLATEIAVDGGAWRSTSTSAEDSLDTQGLADGTHTVQVRAIDTAGKTGYSRLLSYAVENAPQVRIVSPAADAVLTGTVTITYTAAAAAPAVIDSVFIAVDGGAYVPVSSGSTHMLATGTLEDGAHLLQLKAVDSDGRTGLSGILKVNTVNRPSVSILSPAADAVVSGTVTVLFSAQAAGTAAIESTFVSIDGSGFIATTTGSSYVWISGTYEDGAHLLRIRAVDSNGKDGFSDIVKVVAANAPTVTVDSPAADAVLSDTVTIVFSARPVGSAVIDSTYISIDGAEYAATTTGSTHVWASGPAEDGTHIFRIRAVDNNGKSGFSGIIKVITANSPSVVIDAPAAGAAVSGTLPVIFTASTVASASIQSRQISVDGGTWRATSGTGSDTLDTQLLAEGTHALQIRVTDSYGKSGLSSPVLVTLANAPSVTLTAPAAGTMISGLATVAFTALPVRPAVIGSTFISVDGGGWEPTASGTSHVLTTVNLLDGTHSLQIKAVDSNGKSGLSARIEVQTWNCPAIAFTAPAAGTALKGQVTVTFTVSPVAPAAADSVLVSVDGGVYTSADNGSTFTWNTVPLRDGEHVLKLKVVDDKGKTGESDLLLVTTDNSAPLISGAGVTYAADGAVGDSGIVSLAATMVDLGAGLDPAALYAAVPALGLDSLPLADIGITGDSRYGVILRPTGLSSGPVGYVLSAADILGNAISLTDTFYFDGTAPQLGVTAVPRARGGTDALHGNVYFSRIQLQGTFADQHSGVARVWITHTAGPAESLAIGTSPFVLDEEADGFSVPVDLVEGSNYLTVNVRDNAGNLTTREVSLTYIPPKVSGIIGPEGGSLVNPDGTSLIVPANALAADLTISITRIGTDALPSPAQSGLTLLGGAYDFGPDGTVFRTEVTLTLAYTQAELDVDGDGTADVAETGLEVYFLDGTRWLPAGKAAVDTAANTVSVAVNHFTVYAIGSAAAAPAGTEHYWTCNPVLRTEQSTFVYTLDSDARISLHILDLAGDLVRTILSDEPKQAGAHSIKWNGNNARDVFAGTGLYVYIFRIETDSGVTVVKKPIAIINK